MTSDSEPHRVPQVDLGVDITAQSFEAGKLQLHRTTGMVGRS